MMEQPPKWVGKLLRALLKDHLVEEIEGDLLEFYHEWLEEFGKRKADRKYVLHALKFIRPYAIQFFPTKQNHLTMLTSHIKLAWRQLIRQKAFSLIKIGGFAVAIAACSLIALYVQYQTSFDTHYEKQDRIYRLVNRWSDSDETGYWASVHGPLKLILEDNIPEIEKAARTVTWDWGEGGDNLLSLTNSTQQYYEDGFIYADPELLSILEIPMKYGSQLTALKEPNSVVISEKIAEKYFPNTNPVGQQFVLNNKKESTYTIGGVMEKSTKNTHLQENFILTLAERKSGPGTTDWCCTNYNLYVLLTPGASKTEVEEKTKLIRNTLVMDELRNVEASGLEEMEKYQTYYLQSVSDIYLNPEKVGDELRHGSVEFIWIFSISSLVVLVLACINFVNLSTAKAITRAKEVGVRKALGSFKSNLIFQYLVESWMNTLLAFGVAILLTTLLLPAFNQLAGTEVAVPWEDFRLYIVLLASILVIGFLSGSYPAYYLSSFQPIKVLKKKVADSGTNAFVRNATIVFQFAITFILITSAMGLYRQFDFVMNKTLGFEKDQVINIVGLETMDARGKELLKNELENLSEVQQVTSSDFLPVDGGAIQNRSFWNLGKKGIDAGFEAAYWWVDENYLSTMQIELMEGRNFRKDGDKQSLLINEQMAEALQISDPIGKQVVDMFDEKYTIIGVIKDFHFESILQDTRPLAMVKGSGRSTVSVKLASEDVNASLASIEAVWSQINPKQPLRYQFMDARFERMYEELNRAKLLFLAFSLLSISIACSGLFAMSVYMIERRRKEVGVRKVLGASTSRIFYLLSSDFLKLILVATMIAAPLSWLFLDELMAEFANRIELNWPFFLLAGLLVFMIGMSTVSFETIKATLVNPADSLQDE